MNVSDSERLASTLEKQGYKWTQNKYQADLVAVNTCGVMQTAEKRIYGMIPDIKKRNKKVKIIVTGCLVYRKDVRRRMDKYVDEWKLITDVAKGGCLDYLKIIPKYESKISAFIPIGNGCNNYCSYCVVPYARGREVWRPAADIFAEVKNLVKNEYKEIILIAQNVNSYKSGKIDFADLLKKINNIPGDFTIKFMTSHPKDMSDKLIKTMADCDKFSRQIHLPVQSGDDEILKKMNRKYTAGAYVNLVKKIRQAMPDADISTDIIVGFCGETKKQFNNTVKLMKQIKFNQAFIARYTPRPGTAAYKMADNVTKENKKQRWLILNSLIK